MIAVASPSAKTDRVVLAKQQYYHADGYIKAIGKNAHRTIYSSNAAKRHKWQAALHYLTRVKHRAYLTLHPAPRVLPSSYWAGVEIAAAERIAAASTNDPWPNCPDPHDGGGSWNDTVNCENGGNWYDSPGYYRCGLQFDPAWERRFGYKFCP